MIRLAGYHECIRGCSLHWGTSSVHWGTPVLLLNTPNAPMISSQEIMISPNALNTLNVPMISPHTNHDITSTVQHPMHSWYPPNELNNPQYTDDILQCTAHTLYKVIFAFEMRFNRSSYHLFKLDHTCLAKCPDNICLNDQRRADTTYGFLSPPVWFMLREFQEFSRGLLTSILASTTMMFDPSLPVSARLILSYRSGESFQLFLLLASIYS